MSRTKLILLVWSFPNFVLGVFKSYSYFLRTICIIKGFKVSCIFFCSLSINFYIQISLVTIFKLLSIELKTKQKILDKIPWKFHSKKNLFFLYAQCWDCQIYRSVTVRSFKNKRCGMHLYLNVDRVGETNEPTTERTMCMYDSVFSARTMCEAIRRTRLSVCFQLYVHNRSECS